MAAGDTLEGRRVEHPNEVEQPGDYCGPITGYTGELQAVVFLKPHARDPETHGRGRSIQHVTSPPHTFREEDDGSLTIAPSIGDTSRSDPTSDGWHGYLEHGVWREV